MLLALRCYISGNGNASMVVCSPPWPLSRSQGLWLYVSCSLTTICFGTSMHLQACHFPWDSQYVDVLQLFLPPIFKRLMTSCSSGRWEHSSRSQVPSTMGRQTFGAHYVRSGQYIEPAHHLFPYAHDDANQMLTHHQVAPQHASFCPLYPCPHTELWHVMSGSLHAVSAWIPPIPSAFIRSHSHSTSLIHFAILSVFCIFRCVFSRLMQINWGFS